ncbi:MAG: hypothetical protein E7J63_20285 [Pantoea sp.]|uniref:hypothetical protein n=1 Tax=Pantoea sp. TaxID=69393 RepID=UPI002909E62B|nr:hypothetical protein [Pantoea sp.]MDU7840620.1 hypothetical protein [Pantoea sp.]
MQSKIVWRMSKMVLTLSRPAMLSALLFQAKTDPRYYLIGMCFAPNKKLYATDGHRLFVGEHQTESVEQNIIVRLKGPKFTRFARAEIDTDSGVVTYFDSLEQRVNLGLCEVVDGKYPDVDRVIPKENVAVTEIGFNARYLADVEKVAKLYNPKFESICIKPNGNTSGSLIEISTYGEKAKIVLMPQRLS